MQAIPMLARRVLVGTFGALYAINAMVMLIDPVGWFERVPGASDTGPFNPHFVYDVGLAFLASGAALLAFSWKPRLWPAAVVGAAFPTLHALLHIFELAIGRSHHLGPDLLLVVLPSALTVALVWPPKGALNA